MLVQVFQFRKVKGEKVKKFYSIIFSLAVIAFQISCKSYTIPYDQKFEGRTIETGIYVFKMPSPFVQYSGSGLMMLGKGAIHSSAIEKAYMDADLRSIFYDELQKNGRAISPKIAVSMKKTTEKDIEIRNTESTQSNDPKRCDLVFEGIPEKLGKDYLFTIKVLNYGFYEGSYSISSKIEYVASISDMKNNVKIWQMKSYRESKYPIFSSFSVAKDPVSTGSSLRDCVIGVIQDISKDINKIQKK